MSTVVLDVQDLHKTFTLHLRGGAQLPVLRGVSLQVAAGQCVALVGPSGRGKSTLMKCLYGSYGAQQGHMWLHLASADGSVAAMQAAAPIDLASASAQQVAALRRREIAYVSQFLRVLPRVSALDVVAERLLQAQTPAVAGTDADPLDDAPVQAALDAARLRAADLLRRLHLPEGLWGLPPATFSGGEQQRINIARGFIQPARLLLLDEPTASLDAANRAVVVQLIHEAKAAGAAVVGIFHDLAVRDAVADRTLLLDTA